MVGNDGVHTTDEWPEIGPFTTISQLKSIVDNHADTMTMTVTASGNYLAAVPSNNKWNFLFNINADDGYLPKGGMQGEYYADPNIWDVAQYAIVFIESQPEH